MRSDNTHKYRKYIRGICGQFLKINGIKSVLNAIAITQYELLTTV